MAHLGKGYGYEKNDETGCLIAVLCVIAVIALLFIGPAITMWLWNWIAVSLFNAPVIGYWTAFGLQWLCHILFGRTVTVRSGN